jgi:radical SAM protein with 4Fe4S-binding SPASM domain
MVGFQTMSEVPDETTGLCKPNGATVSGCTYPFKQLVIDYEGDILPCCKMGGKELRLGNIEDMTLKEAWNSIAMKRLQKLHKDGRWHENEVCRRCIGSMT